jgi:hypothetical protein
MTAGTVIEAFDIGKDIALGFCTGASGYSTLARVRTSGGFWQAIKMLPSELGWPPTT